MSVNLDEKLGKGLSNLFSSSFIPHLAQQSKQSKSKISSSTPTSATSESTLPPPSSPPPPPAAPLDSVLMNKLLQKIEQLEKKIDGISHISNPTSNQKPKPKRPHSPPLTPTPMISWAASSIPPHHPLTTKSSQSVTSSVASASASNVSLASDNHYRVLSPPSSLTGTGTYNNDGSGGDDLRELASRLDVSAAEFLFFHFPFF